MPRHSSGKERAGASSRAPYPSPTLSTSPGRKGKASASGSPGKPKRATADRLLSLAGKLPPYNDWQGAAVDDASHYMYIFGGCPPPVAEEELAPSSHLFRLDLKKSPMDWVDFTTRLRPLGHFASATEIPPRLGSGVAFFRHDMRPYLIIFGGWGSGQLRSEFITVDLVDLTWELHSEVSDGILRVEPAVTVVDDRVCIFGGRSGETFQSGPAESSFCVIRMNAQTRRWEWEKKDVPVPVPALGSQLGAVRWELGILIVRGRCAPGEIALEKAFINYDLDRNRWSSITLDGDMPPVAEWFHLRSAGLPRKEVPYLCVWYETDRKEPGTDDTCVACDLWVIEKGVVQDRIKRLHVDTPIWRCREHADLEMFQQLRDGRLLMFGKQEGVQPETWSRALDVTEDAKAR